MFPLTTSLGIEYCHPQSAPLKLLFKTINRHPCISPTILPPLVSRVTDRLSIGPILDDRLKEKILKPWKGALSSHSVCLSVCLSVCPSVCERPTGYTFWPRNLIFGQNDLWDMKKHTFFFFFRIFIFTLFIDIFRFFPYITLVNFCLSVCSRVTGHTFWPRNLIFGLIDPWDMRKKAFFCFSKCSFLRFL